MYCHRPSDNFCRTKIILSITGTVSLVYILFLYEIHFLAYFFSHFAGKGFNKMRIIELFYK